MFECEIRDIFLLSLRYPLVPVHPYSFRIPHLRILSHDDGSRIRDPVGEERRYVFFWVPGCGDVD